MRGKQLSAKQSIGWLLVLLFLPIATCTVPGPTDLGTLTGHVSIGPLSPVVQEGVPEPTPGPELYEGREVIIFDENGSDELGRVPIDGDGNYHATLPVGTYVISTNFRGIEFSKDLPHTVEILTDHTTRLDFHLDTGIR
jgi:hypothetical protein